MTDRQLVSIVIPVYNEAQSIEKVLERVVKAPLPDWCDREIVIVDDGSRDKTVLRIQRFVRSHGVNGIVLHRGLINHGKGAALRAGFEIATGSIILVQDGDLEYSPSDYINLLLPFANPEIEVVYGSRFTLGMPKGMKFKNAVANKILALSASFLFRQNITDEATGFKVFRHSVLNRVSLKCRGFEFCPEFTAKVARLGVRITEVPIQYNPRSIDEGKKIRAVDGFIALWTLVKFRLTPTRLFELTPRSKELELESSSRLAS